MKKPRTLLFFAVALFAAVSCNKAKSDPDTPGNLVDPVDTPLSKTEITERLDNIGADLVNTVPTSIMERANDIYTDVANIDFEEYDEEDLDNIMSLYDSNWRTCMRNWESNGISFFEFSIEASKFHGHVTFANGHVKFEEADDFMVSLPSSKGKPVVIKVTHSKETVTVHYRSESSEGYPYQDDYFVKVPKKINLSLDYDGETVVKNELNFNASLTDGMPNIGKDSFSISMDMNILGLNYKVERLQYEGKKLNLSFGLSYNSKDLIGLSAQAQNNSINSIEDIEEPDPESIEISNTKVKVNILERAQIIASMPSFNKFSKLMSKLYENDEDEMEFKSYLGQVNETYDAGLYFSSDIKQAEVSLEPRAVNQGRYWDIEGVIKFSDGSTYSTFSAFFNDVNFGKVMKAIEKWMNDIEKIIG